MTAPVEWIITAHAHSRAQDRHGVAFERERFHPACIGRDGLRLWLDDLGNGVLVREDFGTGWAQHTVITSLSQEQVKRSRENLGKSGFKRMTTYGLTFDVKLKWTTDRWDVLRFMSTVTGLYRCKHLADTAGIKDHMAFGKALVRLREEGYVNRPTKLTWAITPHGRARLGLKDSQ